MPDDSRTFDVPLAGISRRRLLQIAGAVAAAVLTPAGRTLLPGGALHGSDVFPDGDIPGGDVFRSGSGSATHPDPRPGITGERVLTAGQLHDAEDMIDVFDGIRAIPHIADGIRCYCGCANVGGYRSLLSCYEGAGMARYCDICEGEGRLAVRRYAEGQNLDQIRRAIDARYAHSGHATAATEAKSHCGR